MKRIAILVFAAVFLFAAAASAAEVNVSAAASLREAVNALTDSFAKPHPGIKFQSNFGGSGALAKQIENGAPADVFFSANLEWMDYLGQESLWRTKCLHFAYNVLVFVGKPESKREQASGRGQAEEDRDRQPEERACGEYAMDAFKKAGIEKQIENKLVMAKDVRECLLYAEQRRSGRLLCV